MNKFELLVEGLKKNNYERIYLSHEPWQEKVARAFARRLTERGFKVIVGADARPHKGRPQDEEDFYIVKKVIDSCDAVVVYAAY